MIVLEQAGQARNTKMGSDHLYISNIRKGDRPQFIDNAFETTNH